MLLALEGIDGSGKGTQTQLLQERANKTGMRAAHISYPQYGLNPFAEVVSAYLNGFFGEVDAVHPRLSSLLFAGDRFASKSILQDALKSHELVILDRYVASNLAHQAAKLAVHERRAFIEWLYGIEFETYSLPKPDLTVHLDVPVETARMLVDEKPSREQAYTPLKADIHEMNADYLRNCRDVYEFLVHGNIAGPWEVIRCVSETGELLSPTEVSDRLWLVVRNQMTRH